MSPFDMDLISLTPKQKTKSTSPGLEKIISRELFKLNEGVPENSEANISLSVPSTDLVLSRYTDIDDSDSLDQISEEILASDTNNIQPLLAPLNVNSSEILMEEHIGIKIVKEIIEHLLTFSSSNSLEMKITDHEGNREFGLSSTSTSAYSIIDTHTVLLSPPLNEKEEEFLEDESNIEEVRDDWGFDGLITKQNLIEPPISSVSPLCGRIKETDSGRLESLYSCDEEGCEKKYNTFWSLVRHLSKYHGREQVDKSSRKCNICGKSVLYLAQHMKVKHRNIQKPQVCDVCLKPVKTKTRGP